MFNRLLCLCFIAVALVCSATAAFAQPLNSFRISDFSMGSSVAEVNQILSQQYGIQLSEAPHTVFESAQKQMNFGLQRELKITTYRASDAVVFVFHQNKLVQIQRSVSAKDSEIGMLIGELQKIYGGTVYAINQNDNNVKYDPQKITVYNYYKRIIYAGGNGKYEVWLSAAPSHNFHSVVYSVKGWAESLRASSENLKEDKKNEGSARIGNMGL